MELINALNWRYATKKMTDTKVPAEKVNEITEAIRLTATSLGLQPFRIFVIDNKEVKAKLQTASFNPQITESSHLIVFAVYETITQDHIDEYINLVSQVRNTPLENLDGYKNMIKGFLNNSTDDIFSWATKQAYIALGTGLIAAANLEVDATPMEGFKPAEFDQILGLKEKGLKSVVLLALGYRDEAKDPLAKMQKVRFPIEQFATIID
jgi:nitroreductase